MTTVPITRTPVKVLHPECRMRGDCLACRDARSSTQPCPQRAADPAADAILYGNDPLEHAGSRDGRETAR